MPGAASRWIATCLLAAGLAALPAGTGARGGERVANDLLHADLPLLGHYGADAGNVWPHHFEADAGFGCLTRIRDGEWSLRSSADPEGRHARWYRFDNRSAIHCAAGVSEAGRREDLPDHGDRPAFFVRLDVIRVDGVETELWALQMGAVPGSDYLLLAREPADGMIDRFDVLQADCPRGLVRDAGADTLDSLVTRYCAIDSRRALERLARRMARRPPRGTLALAPTAPPSAPPLAEGLHVFRLSSAEHPSMPRPEVIVLVDGTHIAVRHPAGSPAGTEPIAEGTLVWHAASGQWVIAREPADAQAEEVGGCTGGPEVVDPARGVVEVC